MAVLDENAERFYALDSSFSGYTVSGSPIDQDVLRQAGIEGCDAVLAMTEEDNINIMVCQIAREIFHVKTVLARIFDPDREEVFSAFNISTISPTNLTVDVVLSALSGSYETRQTLIGNATLSYYTVRPQKEWVGRRLEDLRIAGAHLLGVIGENGGFSLILNDRATLKNGEKLVAVRRID